MDFNGRSYETVGSSSKDIILKTRGKVKIQYGSKLIDLVKDGKINTDAKLVYKGKEVGVQDGLYVLDNGEVWVVAGSTKMALVGGTGTTFVSFLAGQEVDAGQKRNALYNIGLIYKDYESLEDANIEAGIVYVEDEQTLYIIQDGNISQYALPTPFKGRLVIENPGTTKGSVVINGSGDTNSLLFNGMCVYTKDSDSYIDLDGTLHIRVGENEKMQVADKFTTVKNTLVAGGIQSNSTSENYGFSLSIKDGESFLKVDNIFLRGEISDPQGSQGFYTIAPKNTILLVLTSSSLPTGWYPCDGTERTIDPETGIEIQKQTSSSSSETEGETSSGTETGVSFTPPKLNAPSDKVVYIIKSY